ncbi:MAG: enoyl-CoA hydratase-related protein, partial [Arenimonas sp.]
MNQFSGLSPKHWQLEARNDGILLLSLERKDASVNTLCQAVLNELDGLLERMAFAPPKGLIIRSTKKAGFIAGADIAEFAEFDAKGTVLDAISNGQNIFQRIAELPCPTVALIHGHCMGGGTELSLACSARVASDDASTRIGLPEVKLGIYPGWGGSVRLPRLVGAPAAFDMMLTGRALSGKAARAIGVVDAVTAPALMVNKAGEFIEHGVKRPFKQKATAWLSNSWLARQILPGVLTKQVARKARKAHYPAPYSLIDTWRRSGGMPVRAALKQEGYSV